MNPFERHIREKLDGHRPELPADAWQRFTHRLDEAERFDQAVRDKLARLDSRYQPAHWRMLRNQLDRRARMLRDLHLTRGLELALFFLLMYSLGNLPHTVIPSPWDEQAHIETPRSSDLTVSATPIHTKPTEITPAGLGTASPVEASATAFRGADRPNDEAPHNTLSSIDLPIAYSKEGLAPPMEDGSAISPIPFDTEAPVEQAVLTPTAVQPLQSPAVSILPAGKPSVQIPLVQAHRRFRHRVSLSLGRDLHHILTPYDHLLSNRGYDQWAGGNSGSFGYTWEGRKWGIRTHLAYHDLGYLPKPFTEVFDGDMQRGYFTESIKTIELNLLSVDLQVSRSIARLGSWNLYAVAGIAGHMAILANYDRRQEFLPGTDPLPAGETPQPTRPSKISQKRFADGIIEGGGFAENSFLTLDGGFGFERHLNGRISLFQENTLRLNPFRRSLGPNNDRINSLGLTAGVRVLL